MKEHNQVARVSPLELLSARRNIHAARYAGMDLTAWANKHSTWRDGRKCPAVDKAQQPRPDVGRRANRVLSTMNRWPGSVVDELRPQFDASPVKNQTGHLVGEDLVFDVVRPKKNAAGGAPSLPLTRPGVHGLGRTSRQDAALDESAELCPDRRLGDRNVAIVAAAADLRRPAHVATRSIRATIVAGQQIGKRVLRLRAGGLLGEGRDEPLRGGPMRRLLPARRAGQGRESRGHRRVFGLPHARLQGRPQRPTEETQWQGPYPAFRDSLPRWPRSQGGPSCSMVRSPSSTASSDSRFAWLRDPDREATPPC